MSLPLDRLAAARHLISHVHLSRDCLLPGLSGSPLFFDRFCRFGLNVFKALGLLTCHSVPSAACGIELLCRIHVIGVWIMRGIGNNDSNHPYAKVGYQGDQNVPEWIEVYYAQIAERTCPALARYKVHCSRPSCPPGKE